MNYLAEHLFSFDSHKEWFQSKLYDDSHGMLKHKFEALAQKENLTQKEGELERLFELFRQHLPFIEKEKGGKISTRGSSGIKITMPANTGFISAIATNLQDDSAIQPLKYHYILGPLIEASPNKNELEVAKKSLDSKLKENAIHSFELIKAWDLWILRQEFYLSNKDASLIHWSVQKALVEIINDNEAQVIQEIIEAFKTIKILLMQKKPSDNNEKKLVQLLYFIESWTYRHPLKKSALLPGLFDILEFVSNATNRLKTEKMPPPSLESVLELREILVRTILNFYFASWETDGPQNILGSYQKQLNTLPKKIPFIKGSQVQPILLQSFIANCVRRSPKNFSELSITEKISQRTELEKSVVFDLFNNEQWDPITILGDINKMWMKYWRAQLPPQL